MSRKMKLLVWFLTLASVLFAWVVPQMILLWSSSSAFESATTLFDWLSSADLSWCLLLYVCVSFIFFYACYRWLFRLKLFWRIILFAVPVILFSGLLFCFLQSVLIFYENRNYRPERSFCDQENVLGETLQKKTDRMRQMVAERPLPYQRNGEMSSVNEEKRNGNAFDVNSYFTVLTNLSVADGYVVDYEHTEGANGFPIIYARHESELAAGSFEMVGRKCSEIGEMGQASFRGDWGNAIRINPTPDGYLEFAAFYLIGGQFYLFWHANYNDLRIIASTGKLEAVVNREAFFGRKLPVSCRIKAIDLDVRPKVEIGSDVVTVGLLTFSKWGGFSRTTLVISRNPPYRVLSEEEVPLVRYNCGIMY